MLPVRVYYEDTDAGGVVYHANYLQILRARPHRLPAAARASTSSKLRRHAGFVVRRMICDFLKPARLDDLLEVETRLLEWRRRPAGAGPAVCRRDGELLFSAAVTVALIDRPRTAQAAAARHGRALQIPFGIIIVTHP
ncbi:MAG: hotdog domain-containing protein [Cypionkella sp.]